MTTTILILPGLGNSGEDHWQTYWLKKIENSKKVCQDNWDEPNLQEWVSRLNETIISLEGPVILIAHSLAVSLVAHWAEQYSNGNVLGALLVAPADVDSPEHTPEVVRGFAPMPTSILSFPSVVVASEDDNFVSLDRARSFAEQWGSRFISVGPKGHINSDSKLEYWEEGQNILKTLLEELS